MPRSHTCTYLEDLGFADTRVADQKDVDIPSVSRASRASSSCDALVGAAEELQQNALLNILHSPDRRRERSRQNLVNIGPLAQLLQSGFHLCAFRLRSIAVCSVFNLIFATDATDAGDAVAASRTGALIEPEFVVCAQAHVYDVQERLEEALQSSLAGVDTYRYASEDACYDQTVARLRDVHEFVVDAERDGMRSLAVGDSVGGFLQSYDLPVSKFTSVVNERHSANRRADVARAALRFVDFSTINLDLHRVVASQAAEERDLHVGNYGSCADDEALDADQLVRIYPGGDVSMSDEQTTTHTPVGFSSRMFTDGRPKGLIL